MFAIVSITGGRSDRPRSGNTTTRTETGYSGARENSKDKSREDTKRSRQGKCHLKIDSDPAAKIT